MPTSHSGEHRSWMQPECLPALLWYHHQLLSRATAYSQQQPFCNSEWAFIKTSLIFVALTLREILQPRHARCLREFKRCLAQPRAVSVSNLTWATASGLIRRYKTSDCWARQLLAILSNALPTSMTEGQMWGSRDVACILPFAPNTHKKEWISLKRICLAYVAI